MTSGFLRPRLGPFPFVVGLFALALFAFLAAVYLTVEADDNALREDFRRRALAQYPFLVPPDISLMQAAASQRVLRPVLWGIALGSLILVPSSLYLFRVFKGE